jgi:hypothetical protein
MLARDLWKAGKSIFTLHKSCLCYTIMRPSLKSTLRTRQNQEAINKMTKRQATIPCIHSLIQKSYVLIQFNDQWPQFEEPPPYESGSTNKFKVLWSADTEGVDNNVTPLTERITHK